MKVEVVNNMDELERCETNDEFYGPPDWYKFTHPCGHIEKQEQFFYDPKDPEPRVLVVMDTEQCKNCSSFFVHGSKGYCQGIKIVVSGEIS